MSADDRWGSDGLEARRRRLGAAKPACGIDGCPERDPRSLTGTWPDIVCCEHRAIAQGRWWIEWQHVAGRHNDPTIVPLPANWHALLTYRQQTAWSRDLLRNPDADPLLRVAASLRGSSETIEVILDQALTPLEAELLDLRSFLVEAIGPDWVDAYRAWQGASRG